MTTESNKTAGTDGLTSKFCRYFLERCQQKRDSSHSLLVKRLKDPFFKQQFNCLLLLWPFSSQDRRVSSRNSSKPSLECLIVECYCEKTPMLLNDRSLTNQNEGLSNSLNLTNQNFFVRLVDEKKTRKTIASLQAVPPLVSFAAVQY